MRRDPSRTNLWVCFPCRRAVKKPRLVVWEDRRRYYVPFPCSSCGRVMIRMGRAFRPPKRGDLEQWRKAEALKRSGFRFDGRGRNGSPELLPKTLEEVPAFLAEAAASRWRGAYRRARPPAKPKSRKDRDSLSPPPVRFLREPGAPPFARRSFRKVRVGQGSGVEVPVRWMNGAWVELRWKTGHALFLAAANLPRHTSINGEAVSRLPRRLHPGDWIGIGEGRGSGRGIAILEW
jgi:hypothetical protein